MYIFIAILFLFYWLFCFAIFYHLTRFGVGTQPKKLAAVFLIGSVFLSFASLIFFLNIDAGSVATNIGESVRSFVQFN